MNHADGLDLNLIRHLLNQCQPVLLVAADHGEARGLLRSLLLKPGQAWVTSHLRPVASMGQMQMALLRDFGVSHVTRNPQKDLLELLAKMRRTARTPVVMLDDAGRWEPAAIGWLQQLSFSQGLLALLVCIDRADLAASEASSGVFSSLDWLRLDSGPTTDDQGDIRPEATPSRPSTQATTASILEQLEKKRPAVAETRVRSPATRPRRTAGFGVRLANSRWVRLLADISPWRMLLFAPFLVIALMAIMYQQEINHWMDGRGKKPPAVADGGQLGQVIERRNETLAAEVDDVGARRPAQDDELSRLEAGQFTLQVMAVQDPALIDRWLSQPLVDSGQAIRWRRGTDDHLLFYGVYPTREDALKARLALINAGLGTDVWLRKTADLVPGR